MPFYKDLSSRRYIHSLILLMGLCFFLSCKQASVPETKTAGTSVAYAQGFDIEDKGDYQLLHFFRHYEKAIDTLSYQLQPRSSSLEKDKQADALITVPVEKIISLASPYAAMLEKLEALDKLVAIDQGDFVYSASVRDKLSQGALTELGGGPNLDVEKALSLEADILLYSAFPGSQSSKLEQLEALGTQTLPLAEWQEYSMLGRAEWIKVFGALLGKRKEADSIFLEIDQIYQEVVAQVKPLSRQPVIISSLPFKGIWSVPGGDSYMAKLYQDAGARYYWRDQEGTASIPLSFEAVYPAGLEANIWISPGAIRSYKALIAQDERFLDFSSVQNNKVYHNYKRSLQTGGNDYWESGVINPHLILKDLVSIFHPELLPGYTRVYFEALEE
ncbi:MAG: ABC transporter substrate-binding protein [Bacteroidia bacterium]|nr:ABC transporter substrate-binding protein [Bacteroidia bacterium]